MDYGITIHREISDERDGWTYHTVGQVYHDCSLGALVQYLKDCQILKPGDQYNVVNSFDGTYKHKIAK